MRPDYDLTCLETAQADVWLFLRVDAIFAQILADQVRRRASTRPRRPHSRPRWHQRHYRDQLHTRSDSLPGRIDEGALNGLLSQPILLQASPSFSVSMQMQAASSWVH
jgi:hypothetical protein